MSTSDKIALAALIVISATLLTYLGQLIVLILVYRRVIKETDRNAEERRREIERNAGERRLELEKASGMMQEMGKTMVQGMNKVARRNTVIMAFMGICLTALLFANRIVVRKFERKNTKE